jgi:hypothetical protein
MLIKGIRTLLLRKPGIDKVLLVIRRFVKETVVLTPAKITLKIATSCAPAPVNLKLPEKGVINVHPDIVKIELGHFARTIFFLLSLTTYILKSQ